MWKVTACIRLLRWGALSAGRHCDPTAQSSSSYQGARDNPPPSPPPGATAGPSRTQAALAGEPGASHHLPANQDRVSESRVCRSRAACYQCGHRAGALSTQWGHTRGCASTGRWERFWKPLAVGRSLASASSCGSWDSPSISLTSPSSGNSHTRAPGVERNARDCPRSGRTPTDPQPWS